MKPCEMDFTFLSVNDVESILAHQKRYIQRRSRHPAIHVTIRDADPGVK